MIYPGAVWRPGVNAGYRAGRNRMQLTVCHFTVGRDSTAIGDRGYFHFLIGRDGTITQFAEADAITWHAGTANQWGPGIEVEYLPGADDDLWTPASYQACAGLVEWLIGLGIPDTFYDGPRIDPAGFSGFLTHRSVAQPDGHFDWWPDLPRAATTPAKPTGGRMLPSLFVDAAGAVWVYDPNTKSKSWVKNPDELAAIQTLWSVAKLNGQPAGDPAIYRNQTTDALLADAVENRTPKDGGGPIDLSGFTITGTFEGKAKK